VRHPAPLPGLIWLALVAVAAADEPRNLLRNPGAEETELANPVHWYAYHRPAAGLRMERDTEQARSGKASLAIASPKQAEEERASNNWAQEVREFPREVPLRLSVWIKAEGAEAVNVCVQGWSREDGLGDMVAFASTPVIRGTQDWALARSRPLVVPPGTRSLVVRAALTGEGKVWFDDLSLVAEPPAAARADDDLAKIAPGRIARAVPVARDVMILKYLPEWDHGNVDNLGVGNYDGGVRALLAWPELSPREVAPPGRRFLLAVYAREARSRGPAGPVQVHEILEDWGERTSWATRPRAAEAPAATAEFEPGAGWKLFDVTPIVRARARTPGVLLRFRDEDRPAREGCQYDIVSREGAGEWSERRPLLLLVDPAP
jgi:hypothetical protein